MPRLPVMSHLRQKQRRARRSALAGALVLGIGSVVVTAVVVALASPSRTQANAEPAGMVLVPGGAYQIGTNDDRSMRNERPSTQVAVDSFWLDETPVTNAQFAAFVEATGYVTTAERPIDWEELKLQLPPGIPKPPAERLGPGSVVFTPPDHAVDLRDMGGWLRWTPGASWKHPMGPQSDIDELMDHPVVHVSWTDAMAYATWAHKRLPTEAEWEAAARGGLVGQRYPWGDEFRPNQVWMANTFTGDFPHDDDGADGFAGTAPVRSFPPNGYGLHGMAGNVWSWTADVYSSDHHTAALAGEPRRVIKGGSFLCHADYCESYRPSARRGTPYDTSTSHIGFRCARSTAPGGPEQE